MNELVIDELPKARHPLHCACLLNAPYALMDVGVLRSVLYPCLT